MLETVIDLGMQGFPLKQMLRAFAEVREFRALGSQSYPMCRALTSALLGRCLEPNTMSFEEVLLERRGAVTEMPSTTEPDTIDDVAHLTDILKAGPLRQWPVEDIMKDKADEVCAGLPDDGGCRLSPGSTE
jgi:hypothetical protein